MTAFPGPPAVWERLARAGLRTLAIDPYESRPPREWNGTLSAAGASPIARCCRAGRGRRAPAEHSPRDMAAARRRPRSSVARRCASCWGCAPSCRGAGPRGDRGRRAARARAYDLAWLTFSAAHLGGHQFWDLSQLAEGRRAREGAAESALEDIYAEVDAAFGRVLSALPDEADIIVTSAVGMDVNSSRADLLPQMLAAVLKGGPLPDDGGGAGAIWRLRAAVPSGARGAIAQALPTARCSSSPRASSCAGSTGRRRRRSVIPPTTRATSASTCGARAGGIVDPGEADALLRRSPMA